MAAILMTGWVIYSHSRYRRNVIIFDWYKWLMSYLYPNDNTFSLQTCLLCCAKVPIDLTHIRVTSNIVGPVVLLRCDAVAGILANGSAAFSESCSNTGPWGNRMLVPAPVNRRNPEQYGQIHYSNPTLAGWQDGRAFVTWPMWNISKFGYLFPQNEYSFMHV